MVTSVVVINGPNLNLLGTRRPEVYGSATLADVEKMCAEAASALDLDLVFRQSNHEGQLIDWIQEAGADVAAGGCIGAVLNPGAFTHTSVALHDAIEGANLPVIEVHISNVHRREDFRHHSFVSPVARGIVVGFGVYGYVLAINGLHRITQEA
jgi:3-dehydroquinate dehydratase-2